LYIVLGVVVLLAVVALVVMNLGGDEPVTVPTPLPGAIQPPTGPETTPSPEPIEVFEIFEGRDPFRPLIAAGTGAGATPAPGETPAPGATPAPAPGQTPAPGGTQPPAVTAAPPPPSGTQAPSNGGTSRSVSIEVTRVADDGSSADVTVNGQSFTGKKAGDSLSNGVTVVGITSPSGCPGNKGRVSFRRNGDTFSLCEGEQTLK
jgi:hypothetical protein